MSAYKDRLSEKWSDAEHSRPASLGAIRGRDLSNDPLTGIFIVPLPSFVDFDTLFLKRNCGCDFSRGNLNQVLD